LSRSTGRVVYVFEFTAAEPADFTEQLMNSIESFFTKLIVKALHKSSPGMTAEDDAKVTKAVSDFVTTSMDLAAVYFALRAAKSTK
jgi:hypothetical protein